jgi:hypothetical protein
MGCGIQGVDCIVKMDSKMVKMYFSFVCKLLSLYLLHADFGRIRTHVHIS